MAFWSWVGFEAAPNYAEESRDPVRNVPRATYISVRRAGCVLHLHVVDGGQRMGSQGNRRSCRCTRVPTSSTIPTTEYVGAFFTKLMGWLIITGSLACGMAFHNAATRYWYAMGREGLLPRESWARPTRCTRAPTWPVACRASLALISDPGVHGRWQRRRRNHAGLDVQCRVPRGLHADGGARRRICC